MSASGFIPFTIDLPGYGYAVSRVKGPSVDETLGGGASPFLPVVDNPVTPPASDDGVVFDIGTADSPFPLKVELRNKENGWLARGGIKVVRTKTRDGWRIGVDDIGRRDPKSLKLVMSLPKAHCGNQVLLAPVKSVDKWGN